MCLVANWQLEDPRFLFSSECLPHACCFSSSTVYTIYWMHNLLCMRFYSRGILNTIHSYTYWSINVNVNCSRLHFSSQRNTSFATEISFLLFFSFLPALNLVIYTLKQVIKKLSRQIYIQTIFNIVFFCLKPSHVFWFSNLESIIILYKQKENNKGLVVLYCTEIMHIYTILSPIFHKTACKQEQFRLI